MCCILQCVLVIVVEKESTSTTLRVEVGVPVSRRWRSCGLQGYCLLPTRPRSEHLVTTSLQHNTEKSFAAYNCHSENNDGTGGWVGAPAGRRRALNRQGELFWSANLFATSKALHDMFFAMCPQLSVDAHGKPKHTQWVYARRDIREGIVGKYGFVCL